MSLFRSTPSPRQLDTALAILRLVVGIAFVLHGGQKLFVFGFAGVTGAFGQMGIPVPALTGPLVALVEFLGGLALVFGLLTRLAAFGLGVDMLGAIAFVHFRNGFFLPNGFEYPLVMLAVAITLMLTGAGRYSLDALVAGRAGSSESLRPIGSAV